MTNGKILVVDDEGTIRVRMRRLLREWGYSPVTAVSGEDALEKAEATQPRLAFMDIKLAGPMDGITLAETLRRRFDLPVIYLTAHADEELLQRARATEPYGYLVKPLQELELYATLEMALSKRELDAELQASEARYRELAVENAHLLEQAQADAKTKAMLLDEVNHRVSNNLLSILGLLEIEEAHAAAKGNFEIAAILQRLERKVQGLSRVHQLLSNSQWSPLYLDDLSYEIIELALSALSPDQCVEMEITPTSLTVTPKQASQLALIINELATNSVKYGMHGRTAGRITVTLQEKDGQIELQYRDDGPGYPPSVVQNAQYDAGLSLATKLMQTLDGTLTFTNQEGAVATLVFPRIHKLQD